MCFVEFPSVGICLNDFLTVRQGLRVFGRTSTEMKWHSH